MNTIITDPALIKGHIYIITNSITGKKYVGQTVSHRKNHNKYRLFGYEGRFRDHISEAICNTKKKQCSYLNNAIRQYGKDAFTVALLTDCDVNMMDTLEQQYIREHNTMYPNGYNLTPGGKGQIYIPVSNNNTLNKPGKRGGCTERSEETRRKMSAQLKNTFNNIEVRQDLMKRTQQQHADSKLQRFIGSQIDISNLDQYIYRINSKISGLMFKIKVGENTTSFVGKHDTPDELYQRAITFLQNVHNATLSNCSGKL